VRDRWADRLREGATVVSSQHTNAVELLGDSQRESNPRYRRERW
jgi:hypothetical protein